MRTLFDVLIPVSLAAVVVVLFIGIFALFRGGEFGRSYSNKLMRLRVLLQFIAILVLVAAFAWNRHGGR
ncbi:MAG: twin transmembrane helix small protein [Caulobacteraceae bacterium]